MASNLRDKLTRYLELIGRAEAETPPGVYRVAVNLVSSQDGPLAAKALLRAIELLERSECHWRDCQDPGADKCDRCAFLDGLDKEGG